MPLARVYTVDSGAIAVAVNTTTPILMCAPPATAQVAVQGIRVWTVSASGSPTYPANAEWTAFLARATNTPAGGTSVTPTPHRAGGTPLAAQSAWTIGSWSTAPTAPLPAAGGILWGQGLPLTAGADWGDWCNPGSEWEIGPSSFAAVFVTCSSAPTNVSFEAQVVFGE